MDSYNTYRDRERDGSGRSPGRDWDGRDDRKPERGGDGFFRGRSPGAYYNHPYTPSPWYRDQFDVPAVVLFHSPSNCMARG